jgi:hypothetical protein
VLYRLRNCKLRGTGFWLCHVPDATRSPSSDKGIVVTSGRKKTLNTWISASVRKKFQCTPYSVTCSFIHRQQRIQFEKESELGQLTGYCVPFTNTTRTKPSTRTGRDFSRTDKTSNRSGGLKSGGFLTNCMTGIAETIPWENTNEPTPMSIY